MKDELWAWFGGIFGAIVIGLVIVAFISGVAEGDFQKGFALFVALLCFGIAPMIWAADLLGAWTYHPDDDEEEDDDTKDDRS